MKSYAQFREVKQENGAYILGEPVLNLGDPNIVSKNTLEVPDCKIELDRYYSGASEIIKFLDTYHPTKTVFVPIAWIPHKMGRYVYNGKRYKMLCRWGWSEVIVEVHGKGATKYMTKHEFSQLPVRD